MTACPVCGHLRSMALNLPAPAPLYRCRDCRVVHRGQRWTDAEIVSHYHPYYENRSGGYDPITDKRYHAILRRVERYVAPGALLDVGCGMGHFLAVAEARGWRATGLEVSASGVAALERIKRDKGYHFDVLQGDVARAEFAPASFRMVSLVEVLEHLVEPVALLQKLKTLLEPGGILYLTTPNFDSLSRHVLGGRWRAATAEHLCLFNPGALRRALAVSGLEELSLHTRNVDVPEILAKCGWRGGQPGGSIDTRCATQAFRHAVEDRLALRVAKRVINTALRWTSLGETLELLARRSELPG